MTWISSVNKVTNQFNLTICLLWYNITYVTIDIMYRILQKELWKIIFNK